MAGPKLTSPNRTFFGRRQKAYSAAMKMFEDLVLDPMYVSMFIARAKEGELHPSLEKMMFEYLLGKPTETVNLNVNDQTKDYSSMTEEEVLEQRVAMHDRLIQLRKKQEELQAKQAPEPTNGKMN